MNRKQEIVWGLIMLALLYSASFIMLSIDEWRREQGVERPQVCRNEFGHRIDC